MPYRSRERGFGGVTKVPCLCIVIRRLLIAMRKDDYRDAQTTDEGNNNIKAIREFGIRNKKKVSKKVGNHEDVL